MEIAQSTHERNQVWSLSQDLLAVIGLDDRLRTINPAWSRLLGFDEATLVATHFSQLVHSEDRADVRDTMAGLRIGEAPSYFEVRIQCSDGGHRWIAWRSAN